MTVQNAPVDAGFDHNVASHAPQSGARKAEPQPQKCSLDAKGSFAYRLVGMAAAMTTVTIWAAWIVSTRYSVTNNLGPVDIGLLRFAVPAIVLSPVWLKHGIWPRGLSPLNGLAMICGSGVLFFLVASTGMQYAPAAHVGALLPGAMPLWAAILGVLFFGERFSALRWAGYATIAIGILLMVAGLFTGHGQPGMWRGYAMFLSAACLWAGYTHAYHKSGMGPLHAAGFIGLWSFVVLAVVAAIRGTALLDVPLANAGLQLLTQGVLSGFVAIICYGIAVRRIGSTRASAFAALAPAFAALGGKWVLGEDLSILAIIAVILVMAGVVLAALATDRVKN